MSLTRRLAATVLVSLASSLFTPGVVSTAAAQENADRQYRSATGLLNRGMHDLAADEYRAFLTAHPNDPNAPTARYALGVCLSRLGRHADACEQLKGVIDIPGFEFAPDALLLLGQSQLLADQPADAARTLERFLKETPTPKQADVAASLLGESHMRAGHPDEAIRAFERLAEQWPRSPMRERADLLWAMCDSSAGRDKEAADRLATLRDRFPKSEQANHATLLEAQCRHRLGETARALELYDRVVKSGAEAFTPDATLGTAQLTRAAGKPEEAAKLLRRLLETPGVQSIEPGARVELARCRLDAGDAAGALEELERLGAAPAALADDAAYWAARAESALGRHEDAAERLKGCEARFGTSELLAEMMYERAEALSRAGRAEEADAALQAMRERYPDHALAADASLARATGAYRAGELAAARVLSESFVQEYPDHPAAATAALLIAECAYRSGDFREAERGYAEFLRRHPGDPNAWHAGVRRGLCLARLGNASEAARVLEACLRDTDAGDPSLRQAAVITLADDAFAAEEWKTAEKWLAQAAATKSAALEESLLKLGLCIHRQARAEEALGVYDRLLREFPRGVHRLQALFERGQALVDLKRENDAAECFASVIKEEADSPPARFSAFATRHLAAISLRQGRADEAAALLARIEPSADDGAGTARLRLDQGVALLAAGKYADAEAALRLAAAPPEAGAAGVEARAQLGVALSRQDRLEDALGALDASRVAPEQPGAGTRDAVLYERISVLRRMGRDEDALAACAAFLAGKPGPRLAAHAHVEAAQLHAKAGRDEEVMKSVSAARRAAPDDATRAAIGDHASYLLGLAQHRLGKHADAIKSLEALVGGGSASAFRASAALVCGEAMLRCGRAADAARMFQDVAGMRGADALAGPALLRLGEARAASADWTGSEEAFSEFLSRFPDSPVWFQARFGIAWSAENQGRHEAAIDAYRMVTAKHEGPTAARAQFQIGECLFALKRHDDAVKELLRVDILYSYPDWSAAALYEAGRCLAEQGKVAEAREQFGQVTTRFGESKWAPLAKEAADRAAPGALPGHVDSSPNRKERAR